MKAKDLKLTLEDFEVLTDKEILSTWSKFASLIRIFDNIDWDEAKKKALELLKEEKAEAYLVKFREKVSPKNISSDESISENKTQQIDLKQKNYERSVKAGLLTIYEKNYLKLLKLCPTLESDLKNFKNGDPLYSLSSSAGYMDFVCEVLDHDNTGYYMSLGHYYVQNGDVMSDPDMEILINTENKTCYALNITQSNFGFKSVYDDKYKRKMINTREFDSQNKFLGVWLKNLMDQDHEISFPKAQTSKKLLDEDKLTVPKKEPVKEVIKEIVIVPLKNESQKVKEEKVNDDVSEVEEKPVEKKIEKPVETEKQVQNTSKTPDESILANKRYKKFISQINYYLFMRLVPNFEKYSLNLEPSFIDDTLFYKVSITKNNVSDVLIINDNIKDKQSEYGLTIELLHKKKILNLVESKSKLKYLIDFSIKPYHENDFSIEDFNAQKALYNFLNKLNEIKCEEIKKVEEKEEIKEEIQPEKIEESSKEVETISIEPSEDSTVNEKTINDILDFDESGKVREIPIFEVGKVQLTEKHIKAGLTQKDIDFINKNRTGLVLRPAKNMTNNTKNYEFDSMKNAKRPGYRVSRTGQIYYESRSNRSDLTPFGL